MVKAKLAKLSFCPCGFSALHEDIPLGTEYMVDPQRKDTGLFGCGGCGNRIKVMCIWVEGRGQSNAGFLPECLFEITKEDT